MKTCLISREIGVWTRGWLTNLLLLPSHTQHDDVVRKEHTTTRCRHSQHRACSLHTPHPSAAAPETYQNRHRWRHVRRQSTGIRRAGVVVTSFVVRSSIRWFRVRTAPPSSPPHSLQKINTIIQDSVNLKDINLQPFQASCINIISDLKDCVRFLFLTPSQKL